MDFIFKVITAAAIITGLHVAHLSSLGTENVILGCLTDEISYPPKSVFWWYATGIESFSTEENSMNPYHFAFSECLGKSYFTPSCLRLLGHMQTKGLDINASSNVEHQFPVLYLAILQCHPEGVEYALANGASLEARPGSPSDYSEVSPTLFLRLTNCENKRVLQPLLSGDFDKRRLKFNPNRKVDWTRHEIFRTTRQ